MVWRTHRISTTREERRNGFTTMVGCERGAQGSWPAVLVCMCRVLAFRPLTSVATPRRHVDLLLYLRRSSDTPQNLQDIWRRRALLHCCTLKTAVTFYKAELFFGRNLLSHNGCHPAFGHTKLCGHRQRYRLLDAWLRTLDTPQPILVSSA